MFAFTIKTLAVLAIFAGSGAIAAENQRLGARSLVERRSDESSVPISGTGKGATCAETFGTGYIVCHEKTDTEDILCYNPDIGEECCSTKWACPAQSFCLGEGYCCPDGQEPQKCAARFTISLPPGFMALAATSSQPEATGGVIVTTVTLTPTASSPSVTFTGGTNAQATCGFVAAVAAAIGLVGNIV